MGLDMYLTTKIAAPAGSPLQAVIDQHLGDAHRRSLDAYYEDEPDCVPSAYVSGWSHDSSKDPLYDAVCVELRFTPHDGSPHFSLTRDGAGGYVVEPTVYYWRKANHIHRWFVENVQNNVDDCGAYPVHPELLADLVERCERVAADPSLAPELLPTQDGFFFGGTEYDEWYLTDTKDTAVTLKTQVEALPRGVQLFYQSSW